ncbi:MAG: hypothetical protein OEW17_11190 [Gemmatimonadota bacterium]|nr:hypothetical protein [Gemmatimonadota bacterium]
MRLSRALLIGILAALPMAAAAQVQTTPIGPGARVRVWAPQHGLVKRKAFVSAISGDTLILTRDSVVVRRGKSVRESSLTYLPLADVRRIEVMTGQHANVVGGLKWGVLIGSGIGTVLGVAALATCDEGDWGGCGGEWVVAGAVSGALWGLLIGTVVGMLDKTEDWQQVWITPGAQPPAVTPTLQVVGNGIALGMRLRL